MYIHNYNNVGFHRIKRKVHEDTPSSQKKSRRNEDDSIQWVNRGSACGSLLCRALYIGFMKEITKQ